MQLLGRPGEEKIHLESVNLSRGCVVNSFGQFTGDVRVSGHISQTEGLGDAAGVGGQLSAARGGVRGEDGPRLEKSLRESLCDAPAPTLLFPPPPPSHPPLAAPPSLIRPSPLFLSTSSHVHGGQTNGAGRWN